MQRRFPFRRLGLPSSGTACAHGRERATTEDLRVAIVHYRALFDELVGESRQPAGAENPR